MSRSRLFMASVRLNSKSAICLSSPLLARFSSIPLIVLPCQCRAVLDSCIPITQSLGFVSRVLQEVFDFVDIEPFWFCHLFSCRLNSVPKVTIAQSPRDTRAQYPRDTIAQSPRHTVAQSPRDTIAQSPRDTIAQSPRDTVAQSPRDTKSETPRIRHLFFLGNLLSCPPKSRLLLVRVVHQRVVRVGGPNVTAAGLYPALRLDKLYAALIRCLRLWTVTKQFLVFLF